MNRRNVLAGAAGLGVCALAPRPVWSQQTVTVGSVEITTLSDGHLTLPGAFVFEPMDPQALPAVLKPFEIDPNAALTPPCNLTLIRDGERAILIDSGAGSGFQSSAGKGLDALETIGLLPEDITHLIFTHGHPDHLWGVLDDFDDPQFPQAAHLMGRAEFDYWMDPNTVDTIGEARASFAAGARRRLEALEDRMERFDDGAELVPGLSAILTPGHTPGHMAFEVRAGSESVFVVGDAIGNHHVAFARPDWPSGSDQDSETAAKTRLGLLDRISGAQARLIGFHLPEGGLGQVERQGQSYRFVPA
ncbi:MAG: MBL fold metallo-hydrolase [Pseudomonadota bacterium]